MGRLRIRRVNHNGWTTRRVDHHDNNNNNNSNNSNDLLDDCYVQKSSSDSSSNSSDHDDDDSIASSDDDYDNHDGHSTHNHHQRRRDQLRDILLFCASWCRGMTSQRTDHSHHDEDHDDEDDNQDDEDEDEDDDNDNDNDVEDRDDDCDDEDDEESNHDRRSRNHGPRRMDRLRNFKVSRRKDQGGRIVKPPRSPSRQFWKRSSHQAVARGRGRNSSSAKSFSHHALTKKKTNKEKSKEAIKNGRFGTSSYTPLNATLILLLLLLIHMEKFNFQRLSTPVDGDDDAINGPNDGHAVRDFQYHGPNSHLDEVDGDGSVESTNHQTHVNIPNDVDPGHDHLLSLRPLPQQPLGWQTVQVDNEDWNALTNGDKIEDTHGLRYRKSWDYGNPNTIQRPVTLTTAITSATRQEAHNQHPRTDPQAIRTLDLAQQQPQTREEVPTFTGHNDGPNNAPRLPQQDYQRIVHQTPPRIQQQAWPMQRQRQQQEEESCSNPLQALQALHARTPRMDPLPWTSFLVGPGLDKALVANAMDTTGEDPGTPRVCEFHDVLFARHFPRAMEQIYRCWSWLMDGPSSAPRVIIYPSNKPQRGFPKTEGGAGNDFAGIVTERHENDGRTLFLNGFNQALQEAKGTSVMLTMDPKNRYRPYAVSMKPHDENKSSWQNQDLYALHHPKHARALAEAFVEHFDFDPATRAGCQAFVSGKRLPRINILNRDMGKSGRSILNPYHLVLAIQDQLALRYPNDLESAAGAGAGGAAAIEVRYFEEADFRDQVDFFTATDIVISPHGAQLTGIVMMPQCGGLLELFPAGYYLPYVYSSLAESTGLYYQALYVSNGDMEDETSQAMRGFKQRQVAGGANMCIQETALAEHVMSMVEQWQSCCHQQQSLN